ncbi:hypothetical protein, partial [Halovibrio sp. HP20-50]|uniref:hypothetical protein n=1 Tax=Halovibrio sp. HP20-59 TaxID=3080275 RepID=UPI00294B1EFA
RKPCVKKRLIKRYMMNSINFVGIRQILIYLHLIEASVPQRILTPTAGAAKSVARNERSFLPSLACDC